MDPEDSDMQRLELKIPPLVVVLITAALMWAIAVYVPAPQFDFSGAIYVAAVVATAGITVAILGVLAFRSAGTTVDPRVPDQTASLVVRGVYRVSRNPMYLGFLLILGAWGVYLGNLAGLVMLPLFIAYMNRFQIRPEERYMHEKFGDEYQLYSKSVRRWI
jgi:protein-S-isoprenylcysteine O-methyltransferase Ste14